MHLVTSAAMVSSLLGVMKPSSASLFLRTYFLFSLIVYVARGRPPLPITDFYEDTTTIPGPPEPTRQSVGGTLSVTANPWLDIIHAATVHPNEHMCKAQRALAHSAVLYGGTFAGVFSSIAEHGLKGAERIDGTLFVRSAGLTANKVGWTREAGREQEWDMRGYF